MKFLVVTTSKHLAPPEVGVMLVQAMHGWLDRHASKTEQVWEGAR